MISSKAKLITLLATAALIFGPAADASAHRARVGGPAAAHSKRPDRRAHRHHRSHHHGKKHPSIPTRGRHAIKAGKHSGVGRGAAPAYNPYTGGGCTYWAWANRSDLPRNLGNAMDWARNAARAGFPVGGVPEVGDIAVYQPHVYGAFAPYGHVAVVVQVSGSRILISEASYNPRLPDDGDNEIYHRWTGIAGVQFIHHRQAAAPPSNPAAPSPAAVTYPHHVYHTCANGACGLRLHAAPSISSTVTGVLGDGAEVDIVCQTTGDGVSGADGSSSPVWDYLSNGSYAADYYIDTPGSNGAFSPPIPLCGSPTPPSSPTPTPTPTPTRGLPNLLYNPSFEIEPGAPGWYRNNLAQAVNEQVYSDPSRAHDGSWFLETNTSQAGGSIAQDVEQAPVAGHEYDFSVWLRSPGGQPFSVCVVVWALGTNNTPGQTCTTVGGAWQQVTATLVPPQIGGQYTKLRAEVYENASGVNLDVDTASLTDSNPNGPGPR
jgi:surface antigen